MLFTSYRLMAYEAGNKPAPLKPVKLALGDIGRYGLDTPMSLEQVANADLQAALWAFRAVYPEQRSLATKLARRYAGMVFRAMAAPYLVKGYEWRAEVDSMRKLAAIADDYLLGLCDKACIEEKSKEAYRIAMSAEPISLRWLGYVAWFALGPKPDRLVPEMLDSALESNPYNSKSEPLQYRKYRNAMSHTLRLKLLDLLEPRDEAIGPVVRGFDGSFTERPKRADEGGNVRAYRHKTTIRNMLEARGI